MHQPLHSPASQFRFTISVELWKKDAEAVVSHNRLEWHPVSTWRKQHSLHREPWTEGWLDTYLNLSIAPSFTDRLVMSADLSEKEQLHTRMCYVTIESTSTTEKKNRVTIATEVETWEILQRGWESLCIGWYILGTGDIQHEQEQRALINIMENKYQS